VLVVVVGSTGADKLVNVCFVRCMMRIWSSVNGARVRWLLAD
jgi:hypothetical protein